MISGTANRLGDGSGLADHVKIVLRFQQSANPSPHQFVIVNEKQLYRHMDKSTDPPTGMRKGMATIP